MGITIAIGVIAFQSESFPESRTFILNDLETLARKAQEFYHRSSEEGGGGESFLPLTVMTHTIKKLDPHPSRAYGEFHIKRTGVSSHVEIIGIGIGRGYNTSLPVKASILVWPDSVALTTHN
jgi:hypothetical protein